MLVFFVLIVIFFIKIVFAIGPRERITIEKRSLKISATSKAISGWMFNIFPLIIYRPSRIPMEPGVMFIKRDNVAITEKYIL